MKRLLCLFLGHDFVSILYPIHGTPIDMSKRTCARCSYTEFFFG